MKRYNKFFMLLASVFLLFFLIGSWQYSTFFKSSVNINLPFSKIISALSLGEVKEIEIEGQIFSGRFKNGTNFESVGILTNSVLNILSLSNKKHGLIYLIKKEKIRTGMLFLQWLPILLIVGLFLLLMRQVKSGKNMMSFGESKAKKLKKKEDKVTFKDVAGVDECKQELEEIIDFLKDPSYFTLLGGRIPKGVLLVGPPGTGKTLLAKAVAGEAGVTFLTISGSDFVEMFVGIGASRVRDLFKQGKKDAPCIIFIDEIDAVGRQRGTGMGGGHDEREQTLNQLLVEMDGFEVNEGIIIIAATNRADVLDPALLRPGRFDRQVVVPKPNFIGRTEIIKVHTKNIPLSYDVNQDKLARSIPGLTGADIANLVNEAALSAARKKKEMVNMKDFEDARDKLWMGPERATLIMSKKELVRTAYHEAGHALVGVLLLGESEPIHKVSIVPRGFALGVTIKLPIQDSYSISKNYIENQIAMLLGGRIAEEISFAEVTSGASDDLKKISKFANQMVCQWGMYPKMGPMIYGKGDQEVFVGRDFSHQQEFSEKTSYKIDKAIRRIILTQYGVAKNLLEENIGVLRKIAESLLEYEVIDGEDIEKLIKNTSISKKKKIEKIQTLKNLQNVRKIKSNINKEY